MARSPPTTSAAAVSPCTRAGRITRWAFGCRRRRTLMMSRNAAPSRDVTMPILRGKAGSGRLRDARTGPPRGASSSIARTRAAVRQGRAAGRARTGADIRPSAHRRQAPACDDVEPVLERELEVANRRTEHHATNLRCFILQREVGDGPCSRPCSWRSHPRPRRRQIRIRTSGGFHRSAR